MSINDNFIFNKNNTSIGRRKQSSERVIIRQEPGCLQ